MEHNLIDLTSIDNQTLFGIPIQQTWTALYMLEKLITEQEIKTIFELGAGNGALTKFFECHTPHFWSFDIKNGDDVFSYRIKRLVTEINLLVLIQPWEKSMIFCDNGDKPREIRTYAPMLKKGDFILGHDYGRLDGIPLDFDYKSLGLETYRQDDWDRMKTYILCCRKI